MSSCAPSSAPPSLLTSFRASPQADVARTADGARLLGHSYVRLLPKENGVRPLINLRRVPKSNTGEPVRDAKGAFVKSINATLKDTFSVLVQSKVRSLVRLVLSRDELVLTTPICPFTGLGRFAVRRFNLGRRRHLPEVEGVQAADRRRRGINAVSSSDMQVSADVALTALISL